MLGAVRKVELYETLQWQRAACSKNPFIHLIFPLENAIFFAFLRKDL